MPPRIIPAHAKRVLAFFPHRRITGRTALDGSGVVPRSFAALDMRHPHVATDAHLEFLVARSIERYRPALVAIGVPGRDDHDLGLARWAAKVVRHFGIACVFVDVAAAAGTVHSAARIAGYDRLGQLVAARLPELGPRVLVENRPTSVANLRRTRSFAWKAALAALAAAGMSDLAHAIFDATSV